MQRVYGTSTILFLKQKKIQRCILSLVHNSYKFTKKNHREFFWQHHWNVLCLQKLFKIAFTNSNICLEVSVKQVVYIFKNAIYCTHSSRYSRNEIIILWKKCQLFHSQQQLFKKRNNHLMKKCQLFHSQQQMLKQQIIIKVFRCPHKKLW